MHEQMLTWVCVCPWNPETDGKFCPGLELIVENTSLTQAFWSLEVSTLHIISTKQGCPPFLAKQFHPPKKTYNHPAHIFLCTRVVLGLARKKEGETERVCVCKVSTHSQEIISDKKNSQGKTNIT